MKVNVGVRGSKLAIAYCNKALDTLKLKDSERIIIESTADLNPTTSIEEMGGKGVFCKEIEDYLMERRIDIAVHAFKDVTRDNDAFLDIPCVIKRNNYHDCLIGNHIDPKTIGTSSPRRMAQLKDLYPLSKIIPIRGNIDTRIAKQESGQYDAIVLAVAGVQELGYTNKITRMFETNEMMPAPGQGVIAVQTVRPITVREHNIVDEIRSKNHLDTWYCAMAERYMLERIDGDCQTPIGSISNINGGALTIEARNWETGKRGFVRGPKENYEELGYELGLRLI